MLNYTLMNKNIPLVEVCLSELGYITEIGSVINAEYFPVGILSEKQDLLKRIAAWWHGRIIPASRDGIRQILYLLDIEDTSSLAKRSMGLSLSDHYWLKPKDSELTWEDVNYFTNGYSRELGELFFSQGSSSRGNISVMSPDASSNGWLKKRWIRIGDKSYLAKAGSAPLFQQPYNEMAAAKLLDTWKIEHVDYTVKIEAERPLSLCADFIDENTEYVPADLVRQLLPRNNNESLYQHFLRCCDSLGIEGMIQFLDNMLLVDYFTANTDRHWGNFGFIRDLNTLKIKSPAPLFDNGTSLWCEAPLFEVGRNKQHVMPFLDNAEEQLKLIQNCNVNIDNIDTDVSIIIDVLNTSPYLEQQRIDKIRVGLENRARGIVNHFAKK